MTTVKKTWLKDNILSMVIIAMIAGYFAYDLADKRKNDDDHIAFNKDISDLKAITYNLVETYNGKREKDQEQDKEILELWKCAKRSGSTSQVIKSD